MSAESRKQPPSIEESVAGLARAIAIAPELASHIAPALDVLSQMQLGLSELNSSKQKKLGQMAVLEQKLAACDPGERRTYVMGMLDISKSTYHEYRGILVNEGLLESDKSGLASDDEDGGW